MREEEDDVCAMIVFILLGHVIALCVGRSALREGEALRRAEELGKQSKTLTL